MRALKAHSKTIAVPDRNREPTSRSAHRLNLKAKQAIDLWLEIAGFRVLLLLCRRDFSINFQKLIRLVLVKVFCEKIVFRILLGNLSKRGTAFDGSRGICESHVSSFLTRECRRQGFSTSFFKNSSIAASVSGRAK
ncbi:MAG: hypothetical protein C4324_05355 [Blastocatellia bacterium]